MRSGAFASLWTELAVKQVRPTCHTGGHSHTFAFQLGLIRCRVISSFRRVGLSRLLDNEVVKITFDELRRSHMSAYTDFVSDFPSRCLNLLDRQLPASRP